MKVSDLNDHLIGKLKIDTFNRMNIELISFTCSIAVECDAKDQFKKCETCFDAVRTHDYSKHKLQEHCKRSFDGNEKKCPLCHYVVVVMSIEEIGWKKHLLEQGCPAADFNRTKN